MKADDILALYKQDKKTEAITELLKSRDNKPVQLKGTNSSVNALLANAVFESYPCTHIFVLSDKESAAYFFNDLENLSEEDKLSFDSRHIFFFPSSYKKTYNPDKADGNQVLMRTEVMSRIVSSNQKTCIVTYPEALSEQVMSKVTLEQNTFHVKKGDQLSIGFVTECLSDFDFECTDFVAEPGQFSIRGGIIDVYSYSGDYPYRIEFSENHIASIRTFDPETQLSVEKHDCMRIIPDISKNPKNEIRESFFKFLDPSSVIWFQNINFTMEVIDFTFEKVKDQCLESDDMPELSEIDNLFVKSDSVITALKDFQIIEFGHHFYHDDANVINYDILQQPIFNKNFQLLVDTMDSNTQQGIKNILLASSEKQSERLIAIINDLNKTRELIHNIDYSVVQLTLHEGFNDKNLNIACYTDHQLFERYHRFHLKDGFKTKEALTIRDFHELQPGDFVTHIDYGIGRFAGLEKIENNGRLQEAIRLVYKDEDILYVSIHSLHRISKYIGKEGTPPVLHRLGSNVWANLKNKTKQKIKDIAKDLIKLYAERKTKEGFQFSPDSYLQHELEASFIYEDTPDQLKSTLDVKKDMEAPYPMDRLICGDVGFGKTEIAIRAAFKAVNDSKQVAVLVPTTILALQHYKTFKERLKDLPCNVDYINRFRTTKEQKQIVKKLADGTIDIIVGTHRIIGKDIKFKDLGLLIIDEEQKFGVANKEKLKQLCVNVDTLTITATPIPRTLQFSLMGARDLSIIYTPPPNRYPILTEIHVFNHEVIRDAINYEISRGGQVYFVHNRVQNIMEVAALIQKVCPDVRIAVGHGQMDGKHLEKIMLDFIEGDYDLLLATTIIESGLDIPNVNTIIINDAQNYGLSDLHQLRGRVGRTNKKAFCHLLAPPLSTLNNEARKRLNAIEEFSELGSGYNIAMRDLDIRGAGNILGAEQSGFISDIGFETYQKILDEAIAELRLQELDVNELQTQENFINDCQVETDLEILIPDSYIESSAERMSVYREMDQATNEESLQTTMQHMIDRFGAIPSETHDLFNAIRLRLKAKKCGIEKIVIKSRTMICYFISNAESEYYNSNVFLQVLDFVKTHPHTCRIKEKNNKLSLTFPNVLSIAQALEQLEKISF